MQTQVKAKLRAELRENVFEIKDLVQWPFGSHGQ